MPKPKFAATSRRFNTAYSRQPTPEQESLMKELQPPSTRAASADPLSIARDLILRPSGLDDGRLDQVFGEVMTHSVDFADLYFQLAHQESWSLEDGMVKDGSASIEQGV